MTIDWKLFYLPNCRYCKKVLAYLATTKNVRIHKYNTEKRSNSDYLNSRTGRRTVPCLYLEEEDEFVFESEVIIQKLKVLEHSRL